MTLEEFLRSILEEEVQSSMFAVPAFVFNLEMYEGNEDA